MNVPRLSADRVPEEFRPWVESALILPLNEALDALEQLSRRVLLSQFNAQLFDRKLTAPSSFAASDAMEQRSELTGDCKGVLVMRCRLLDAAGEPTTGVAPVSCVWEERKLTGSAGRMLRVTSVTGLTAASKYQVDFLAFGG